MIKFYNDDYRTPRERLDASDRSRRAAPVMAERDCSGNTVYPSENSIAIPASCKGKPSLAALYSPVQSFTQLYSTPEALKNGTLFKELNKPFCGGGGI